MTKKVSSGKEIQTKPDMKDSLIKINPDRKNELHEMVNKKKRRFINIIRGWVESDKKGGEET